MQAASADLRVSEPDPENLGIPQGKRSHLNNGVLERFAQNMTENIIQASISQMEMVEPEVDSWVSGFNQNQEMLAEELAEELASAVIELALREVSSGQNVAGVKTDGHQDKNLPFDDESENDRDFLDMVAEMDLGKDIQTGKKGKPSHPPLSQSGLPAVGSLDYPDAPPTTPLLPELERSRSSFARKLKGGLAKVFLPSPPPPTPKDEEDSDSAMKDPRVELMEHLMHSLPADEIARDYFEVGPHDGAKMEAFAEALSCDIIDWVLNAKKGEQIADDDDLHLLAHQLAETIITSSLDEAKMLK